MQLHKEALRLQGGSLASGELEEGGNFNTTIKSSPPYDDPSISKTCSSPARNNEQPNFFSFLKGFFPLPLHKTPEESTFIYQTSMLFHVASLPFPSRDFQLMPCISVQDVFEGWQGHVFHSQGNPITIKTLTALSKVLIAEGE